MNLTTHSGHGRADPCEMLLAVLVRGPLTVPQIAQRAGRSRSTVRRYLYELRDTGRAEVCGLDEDGIQLWRLL